MHISFHGAEADRHIIEAYSGSESLAGMARAAVLVAHYIATGDVRHRSPYSTDLEFFVEAPTQGSLEFPLTLLAHARDAVGEHRKRLAIGLLALVIARATGQAPETELREGQTRIRSGDVDALAEAASPGLLRAHKWVDDADKTINFHTDVRPAISLTVATKEYMETEIAGKRNSTDVSVAALNANSKIGRVYFGDLGRTVPFQVAKEANARTVTNLSRYLTQYVAKTGATVNIDYVPLYYPDERLKRIIIFDCYPIAGER